MTRDTLMPSRVDGPAAIRPDLDFSYSQSDESVFAQVRWEWDTLPRFQHITLFTLILPKHPQAVAVRGRGRGEAYTVAHRRGSFYTLFSKLSQLTPNSCLNSPQSVETIIF